ncbi:hypothetical protein [Acidisphaera sp. S103]|uniref:hypothetical protein n=1 Tax=Acidisphaera sp. S103 TaxID=1747223 RepID=UPI00131C6070|nr:hypothetical protein [Acidisphaera sp. S103]
MLPSYVALTALTDRVRSDDLAVVAAALQTQVMRDFAPEWGAGAVVGAFAFDAIPAGYTPLIVQDTMEADGVNGFHRTRGDDTPYIVVPYGPNWSLAASHELLRMLANPTGSARRPGPSRMPGQGTVEYLVDVCAPCQDVSAAYAIDGVPVSDFCTRAFFGTITQMCSFTGALRAPLEPASNGVVTWLADDALLYQARADRQGRIQVRGGFSPANRAKMLLRELVDMLTPDRLSLLSNASRTNRLVEAEENARRVRFANMTRFHEDIAWRFGHASAIEVTAEPAPRRQVKGTKVGPTGGTEQIKTRPSEEASRTVRTAS